MYQYNYGIRWHIYTYTHSYMYMLYTFLVSVRGGILVWVGGEANYTEPGKLGEKVVTPGNGYLRGNQINLQKIKTGWG
jgi:hypothetical protein